MLAGGEAGAGQHAPAGARAGFMDVARSHALTWRTVLTGAVLVAVAGAALYLGLPGPTEGLAPWPPLSGLGPARLAAAGAAAPPPFPSPLSLPPLAPPFPP